MKAITTQDAPAPVQGAPYSQAIVAPAGAQLAFVSGQVPIDPATGQIVDDDIRAQTARVLANVGAILAAAGSGLGHVVKTTVYLADFDDFGAMNEVYANAFDGHAPARATVEVSRLPIGARVEIDAVAVIPGT